MPDCSLGSVYLAFSLDSSPSPSPQTASYAPCSPRPCHAELPLNVPSLNFAAIPTLNPSPISGPRNSPATPLRTSIVRLRRMNFDAKKEGNSKAGRDGCRYLHLGREASIATPGDDNFLDEMEDDTGLDEGSTMNEEKRRRLVGDLLDWEEDATILDLDTGSGAQEEDKTHEKRPEGSVLDLDTSALSRLFQPLPSLPALESSPLSSPAPKTYNSSIWDDGEKFWHSTPPHPPTTIPSNKHSIIPTTASKTHT